MKIFHTADLHIGMNFRSYPETVREKLKEARLASLERMVETANRLGCDLFAVAGDLFHKEAGISRKVLARTAAALGRFEGACILVLPGNHDYDNDMIEQWAAFNALAPEHLVFLNEERPYPLEAWGLEAAVYPAPCHSKHSKSHNMGWVKQSAPEGDLLRIGMAHGALEGLSPDLNGDYFSMSVRELEAAPVDVWLLGHTHVPYPAEARAAGGRIFNPGTHEPDGLDCGHGGRAWVVTLEKGGEVLAEAVETGLYRFLDQSFAIREGADYEAVRRAVLEKNPGRKVVRIRLEGKVEEAVYRERLALYRELEDQTAYLMVEDDGLGLKVSRELIESEFLEGSFPQKFLERLTEDEEALQLAYELLTEVRK